VFRVRFPRQGLGGPDEEVFEVTFDDGRVESFSMHEYGRVYAVPGLYEEVVQRMLGCATPDVVARMLASASPHPAALRVLDLGAGNGVSGSSLAAAGLRPVVAVDIEPAARPATLRDRPGLYDLVLTADVASLAEEDEAAIRALEPNALTLVGAIGNDHVGPAELRAAALLLTPEALVAYAYPEYEDDGELLAVLASLGAVAELGRETYVHRRTASGDERTWKASVVRLDRTTSAST
jgi:predicted TPR repeat methyltransferase